jgi:hypothetical protein
MVRTVFNGFTGSYFGDWDNQNNFMRATLASRGNVLNAFNVGRPNYFFHHMGMGETIGYSVLRTQNNFDTIDNYYLYPTTDLYCALQISVNLLGDPAVRMQPFEPAHNIDAYQDNCEDRVIINWNNSSDTGVHQYYVSRANHIDSTFTVIGITSDSTFTDSFPMASNIYMVRASKLQTSGSGTYYNLSQGIFDTVVLINLIANADTSICINQSVRLGSINSNLSNVVYSWVPAAGNRDTFSLTVTGSGTKILIATDTNFNCSVSDTFNLTALTLPVSETISSATNSCSDSVTWSSSLNNGGGYSYNWIFTGGSPNDTAGHLLNNPGLIFYVNTGNYLTTLITVDTLTSCQNIDTQFVDVVCSSLPFEFANINCINTIKGKEIKFIVYDNENFINYGIEGFDGNAWKEITRIPSGSERLYTYMDNSLARFKEIRLMGYRISDEPIELGNCYWVDINADWSVFPNPADSKVIVSYNGVLGQQITKLRLYDANGIEVFQTDYRFKDGDLELQLDSYSAGLYNLLIETGETQHQFKIIKR